MLNFVSATKSVKKGLLLQKKKYLLTTLKSALCAHESILIQTVIWIQSFLYISTDRNWYNYFYCFILKWFCRQPWALLFAIHSHFNHISWYFHEYKIYNSFPDYCVKKYKQIGLLQNKVFRSFFWGGGRGASVMVAIFFLNNFYFKDEYTLFRNLQEKEQLKI